MSGFTHKRGEARPFIKWAGGKTQLLEQYEAFLPPRLDGCGYVEPFMGSAAVFFRVLRTRHPDRCTLLDRNASLVNLFVKVRDELPSLIEALAVHDARHNGDGVTEEDRRTWYYTVRAARPPAGSIEDAARLLYLNKTCFNGLYRLNSKGGFNVPMGSYARPVILDGDLLRTASLALQGVRIEVADFRDLGRWVEPGDFVYADPPYEPLSPSSSFTSYAEGGFGQADQRDLLATLQALPASCRWMTSNSTAPFIEALYDVPGVWKHHVQATRNINSKAAGRGRIPELVAMNYEMRGGG